MAGERLPKFDAASANGDPHNNDDTSASSRLLPTDDRTFRKLPERQEPYRDDESSSGPAKEFDLAEPLLSEDTDSSGFPQYVRRHSKWIMTVGLLLAVIVVVFLAFVFQPSREAPSRPSPPPPSYLSQVTPYDSSPTPYVGYSASYGSQSSKQQSVSGFSGPRNTFNFHNGTRFAPGPNLRIIGIIFYGRRQFVNVLECYLRRNLKVNGGMLDEIHFLMHTDIKEDIKWLKKLVIRSGLDKYYKLKAEDTSGRWRLWGTFPELYKNFMTDPDAIYIKMDDDLVFIDDYAILELVRATLEHPEAHSIQTNIVNNKWNHWHHFRTNSIWPYLPDTNRSEKWPEDSWRPSELPHFTGRIPSEKEDFTNINPPSQGHRWLPLEPTYKNLGRTPFGHEIRNPMFKTHEVRNGWPVQAQSHASFFENHERRELQRYSYGSAHDGIWNQWYTRYNINMMAIRGSYVLKNPIWSDRYRKIDKGDEILLTKTIPKELDMPVLVATRAIASHFSFRDARTEMLETDILDRYRNLANELYCEIDNYKPRLGTKLGPHHVPNSSRPPKENEIESVDDEIGDGPQDFINANHDDDDDLEDYNDDDHQP